MIKEVSDRVSVSGGQDSITNTKVSEKSLSLMFRVYNCLPVDFSYNWLVTELVVLLISNKKLTRV
jgi:hypothetical protein